MIIVAIILLAVAAVLAPAVAVARPRMPGWTDHPVRVDIATSAVLLVLVGLAALLFVGVAASLLLSGSSRPDADDAVTSMAEDLRDWDGITYRGEVEQIGRGNFDIDVTVDRDGDIAGVLTRDGGGRAEYARIDGVDMIKANEQWWRDDTQRETKTQRLTGIWVKNPLSETSGISSSSLKSPAALAGDLDMPGLSGSTISLYNETGTEAVDGVNGRVIEGMARRMVISEDATPRLLSIQPSYSSAGSPLRVSRPDPGSLATVNAARAARATAPDYTTKLYEKAKVTLAWQPAVPPLCTTQTCTVGTRVTNTSSFDARGSLSVSLNGLTQGFHPFQLRPGQSVVFTTKAYNPGNDQPGTRVPMRWSADTTVY